MENSNLLNQVVLRFLDEYTPFHEDLSAVVFTPDQHLWLGSDETTTLERLSQLDAHSFGNHQNIQIADLIELPASTEDEIDVEGLTYADYYLWLVGSHSTKRKRPKPDKTETKNLKRLATIESEPNRYILARIPLINGELLPSCDHPENPEQKLTAAKLQLTDKSNVLMEALESDPHLSPFILSGIPSKDNGFDIEGIAICGQKVYLGLRGPVLRGWAIILEIEVEATSETVLGLKQIGAEGQLYKKHFLKLGGLGIRDLSFDGQDLLILAGPTMDLDGPVKLFRVKNGLNLPEDSLVWEPEVLLIIPHGEGKHHAEGITPFTPIAQQPSILVVYDSPDETTLLDGETGVIADVFSLG